MKKMIIAGGTGFLGNACVEYFKSKYDSIIVLTRHMRTSKENITYIPWDAKTLGSWQKHLNDCDVLINMTGRSVDCRYTDRNKKIIMNSRIDATKILGVAISLCKNPPKIWFNSSTATIYRHSLEKQMSEDNGDIGTGFSVGVAKAWEKAFFSQKTSHTRKSCFKNKYRLRKKWRRTHPLKKFS